MAYSALHQHIITPDLAEGRVLDALHNASRSMDAFAWLLYQTHNAAETFLDGDHAMGIYDLMELQRMHLNGIAMKVEGLIEENSKLRGEIAAQDAKGEPATTPRAMSLREEFIAAKSQAGENPGDIASAMNMKRASIEKVIRRLRGEPEGAVPRAAAG